MSQSSQKTPVNLTEVYPVTNLTLVVLLLIPCVVILLLLNCLFLVYKILVLSKKNKRQKREDTEEMLLRSSLPRVRVSDAAFSPLQDGRRAYMSMSEPVLTHPLTSSRASSRERVGVNHRIRNLRPDGATGSGSLRAPSTIRAASSAAGFTPRLHAPPGSRTCSTSTAGWCRSAPVLLQSSDSEAETRVNLVPPNSPMETEHAAHLRRSSTYEMLTEVNSGAAVHPFDKAVMDCEYVHPASDASCPNTSAGGPGLDSDFGASAGVSLRILSADSDGLSNGVLTSALEWDYYDPCYVKQNNIPKHKHHIPAVHTKQYWV
ncbi:protein huluwa isoform 2-T2 [Xenentodon cancila]